MGYQSLKATGSSIFLELEPDVGLKEINSDLNIVLLQYYKQKYQTKRYCMSSTLFNNYIDYALREWKMPFKGSIRLHGIESLLYADDVTIGVETPVFVTRGPQPDIPEK